MEKIKTIILTDFEIKKILEKELDIKIGVIRRNNKSGDFILTEKQVNMKLPMVSEK